MWWLAQIAIYAVSWLASRALSALLARKTRPSPPDPFQPPVAPAGAPIPVLWGTWRVRPITTWFGGAKVRDVKFPHPPHTTAIALAYEYAVTMQQLLCWGAADVANMVFADKYLLSDQALQQTGLEESGQVTHDVVGDTRWINFGPLGYLDLEVYRGGTAATQFYIPNLYGIAARGGGIKGKIILSIGTRQYDQNSLLVAKLGAANVPSYGDFATLVFEDFVNGETANPPTVDFITRRRQTWGGSGGTNVRSITNKTFAWGMTDSNAADIIFDVLTNSKYGLGVPLFLINEASFTAASSQLATEALGMSLFVTSFTTAREVIDECLRTADAVLNRHPETFQWTIALIRNQAPTTGAFDAIRRFNQASITHIEWQKGSARETINEVTVQFTNAENLFRTDSVTLRNLANVAMTGGLRPRTVQYAGVTDRTTALKLCARDLKAGSTILDRGTVKLTRSGWDVERGDVVKLAYPELALDDLLVRVISVDLGEPDDGEITLDVVEDVFSFDAVARDPGTPPPTLTFPVIAPPVVTFEESSEAAEVSTFTFTVSDLEHRIVEIATRTKSGIGAWSAWNVQATASPDTTDPTFPFNDHVTDGDLAGTYDDSVALSDEAASSVEYRIRYIAYSPIDDPLSDVRELNGLATFRQLPPPPNTHQTLADTNPIIWDVTDKPNDTANFTLTADRTLSIIGAVAGFSGVLLVTTSAPHVLTLPDDSVVPGSADPLFNITAGQTKLRVSFDGARYWWNNEGTSQPAARLTAALTSTASLSASLTTQPRLVASLAGSSTLTAALTTGAGLSATLSASASLTANLTAGAQSRAITVDASKIGPADLTGYELLFEGPLAFLKHVSSGGQVTNINGYDICFYADAARTTLLDFEIEPGSYDPTTGDIVAHIKIPATLSHTVNSIACYLGYGDSSITTDQSNPAGVWDANYLSVHHLGTASTLNMNDSTSNARNGTNITVATSGANATSGQVGGAAEMATALKVGYVRLPIFGVTVLPFTISCWLRPNTGVGAYAGFVYSRDASCGGLGFNKSGGSGVAYTWNNNSGSTYNWSSGVNLAGVGVWSYAKLVITATEAIVTVDGVTATNAIAHIAQALDGHMDIGSDNFGAHFFGGAVDEVRISNVDRRATTIAEDNNQRSPSTFYAVGPEI